MALSNVAWGLDVGTTALKAMKLRKDGDQVIVEAFDVVEHEKFLTEPDVDKNEIIKHTLVKFLERNGIKKETIFIGVPGSSTFARFVKLPPVEPKKIPEIVKFEAIQQVPFPLEQVNWDFQTFINPESPEVEVGIFAMKKELVSQVMMNFREVKLDVGGVQMSPLAVYNAVTFDGTTGGKGAVVLDIGAEHTDLIFLDGGRVWLRTINIGGNHFTDSLAKSFKVSFNKAESLKRTAATSKYAKQIFQAMRPIFADLAAEIQRSKGFYDSSHRDSKIEKIIGMGNTFKLPNLQKYIQQEMKLDVIRLESFNRAQVDPKLAAGLSEHALSMASAYGLALQGLGMAAIHTNLLPIEIAKANLWLAKRPWFAAAAAAIVLGMGVVGYKAWANNSAYGVTDADKVDPALGAEMKANDEEIGKQIALDTEWNKIPRSDIEKAIGEVDANRRGTTDRELLLRVYHDLFSVLPQAKANTPKTEVRDEQQLMILTVVKSDYLGPVEWPAWPPATGSGGGGGGNATPATPAGGAPAAVPTDRGFGITLIGYTPMPMVRADGKVTATWLLRSYTSDLEKLNKDKINGKDKPYAFEFPSSSHYDAAKIVINSSGTGVPSSSNTAQQVSFTLPWGSVGGPYWDAFVPDMLKIKRDQPAPEGGPGAGGRGPREGGGFGGGFGGGPAGGGFGGGGTGSDMGRVPGVDPDLPADERTNYPHTLNGYTSFKIQVKVNIKEAAPVVVPPAAGGASGPPGMPPGQQP